MEKRNFSSKGMIDIVWCVTALSRAWTALRAFALTRRLADIGSRGQGHYRR